MEGCSGYFWIMITKSRFYNFTMTVFMEKEITIIIVETQKNAAQ